MQDGAVALGAEKFTKGQQESDNNWQTSFENGTIKNDKWQRHMTSLHYTKVQLVTAVKLDKTAELSQRRPRDAPNIWVPWKASRVLTTHPATFPEICNGLLFRSILRMCVQNLKFVALPVSEIIGGTQRLWGVSGYAHAPFSPKFLKAFCWDGPRECTCQIWSS